MDCQLVLCPQESRLQTLLGKPGRTVLTPNVHKPLTPIVSYLLLFCMVHLQPAQEAERADWCEDSTILPKPGAPG